MSLTSTTNYDFLFKLLLIGDSGVGKSSVVRRFADDQFSQLQTTTIGVDFTIRTIEVEGKHVKLQIWDTAGQERFQTMRLEYYRCTKGFMIVFDLTKKESFENVSKWMDTIEDSGNDAGNVLLIGNKSDLVDERQVKTQTAWKFANDRNLTYLETSALSSKNIEEAFVTMSRELMAIYSMSLRDNTNSIGLGDTAEVSNGWLSGYCSYL